MSTVRGLVRRWLVFAVGVLVWEWATRAAASPFFPSPSVIVRRMHTLWFSGAPDHLFLTPLATANVVPSLTRMAIGLTAAVLAGVTLGLALGRSERVFAYLDPVFQFCRAIPPPTVVPVFMVLFSLGTRMQVASIVFGTIWPILLNTTDGARAVDGLQMATARVFRLSAATRVSRIILPSTLPKIFAGLRLSLSLALILMVFSELLPGTADGVGFELTDAQSRSDLPTMWAVIALLGTLGYLLNTLLVLLEGRVLGRHRAADGS